NSIYVVDALLWGDDVAIKFPVWCDITTKLIIGANSAVPATCFCICIHFEQFASVVLRGSLCPTSSGERPGKIFDVIMCFCFLIIIMALRTPSFHLTIHATHVAVVDYFVLGRRFDIIDGMAAPIPP
ncbi:hypothetical protein BDQ12DRAFT_771056, partial [Crucibulum laeve]